MNVHKKLICWCFRNCPSYAKRYFSTKQPTNAEVRRKRNDLFEKEKERQLALIQRTEKIEVQYNGVPEPGTLIMNKGLSTPYHCAMHISEHITNQSVVAMVDDKLWDMHRPLTDNCKLSFLHFREEDPRKVNDVFWRSCSFILGSILETAFKDEWYIQLHSFPKPNVRSGSFVYDVDLGMPDWSPTSAELRSMSLIAAKMKEKNHMFERLEIHVKLAEEMFSDNIYKFSQLKDISSKSPTGEHLTIYRLGDHIDISKGPMMSSVGFLNRFSISAIHKLKDSESESMYRVQGIAIPTQLKLHYWTYEELVRRSSMLNPANFPKKTKVIAAGIS